MTTQSPAIAAAPARAGAHHSPVAKKRPVAVSILLGAFALAASLAVEFVISGHAFASAASANWGWALVALSITFAIGGAFGPRVVGYLIARRAWGSILLPTLAVIGCLGWSWWNLSGALAEGDEVHRAEAVRKSAAYTFAVSRVAVADRNIASLDAQDAAFEKGDVAAIVGRAQASADTDAEHRNAQRVALGAERARLFAFVAGADPATQGDAIANADRRMRAIDAERTRLLDPDNAAEPFKAADVEIAARRTGLKRQRDAAEAERAKYAPVVASGDVGAGVRSPANMGIAALILALISTMGSGFEIPAKSEAELRRERMDAENADRRRKRAQNRAAREAAENIVDFEEASGRAALDRAVAAKVPARKATAPRLGRTLGDLLNPKAARSA